MPTHQLTAKGKDLSHLTTIEKDYLDQEVQVIILYGEWKEKDYDMVNDPDWIVEAEEDKVAYEQAMKNFEKWDYVTLEDLKKEFNYV